MKALKALLLAIPILFIMFSFKKIHKGNYIMSMTESNGYHIEYESQVVKSTYNRITFNGSEINGVLNKSGKKVDGV